MMRRARDIVVAIVLGLGLILRLLCLFIYLKTKARRSAGRFYRGMRRGGIDRKTAAALKKRYAEAHSMKLRNIIKMAELNQGPHSKHFPGQSKDI